MKDRLVAIAVASILGTASALAEGGPVSTELQLDTELQAQAIQEYWTPERMRAAIPMPMPGALVPEGGVEAESAESELAPDAVPGLAPGWAPGRKGQPEPDSRYEVAADDPLYYVALAGEQPQTSPPFSPPASPTSFGNYAPFNRWSWQQANYLSYPVSTVGKLFFTQSGIAYVCSASVIHRSTLATAGHCVHQGSGGSAGWSTNVMFCPSYIPTAPNPSRGCWAGTQLTTSFQWFSSGNFDRDYGCVVTSPSGTLISNRVGNVTGWLGRAWNWPSRQSTFAWGYPAAAPFAGNRLITVVSTEWYQLNANPSESQLSKYIGNDMTGGSSGGPWWLNQTHSNTELGTTDTSNVTDPFQGHCCPLLNGVNSHKRCSAAGCPSGTVFTQEMGSPQFRSTTTDNNESEDVFAVCFSNGGTS